MSDVNENGGPQIDYTDIVWVRVALATSCPLRPTQDCLTFTGDKPHFSK